MNAEYVFIRRFRFRPIIVVLGCIAVFHADVALADSITARKDLKEIGIEYTAQQFASAAGEGDMTAVKLFLETGMDINAGGGAALGLAAGRGRLEMVKFLLAHGAKPTSNALQYARTRGHEEIEKLLIEAGSSD